MDKLLPTITMPYLLYVAAAERYSFGVQEYVKYMPHAWLVSFPSLHHTSRPRRWAI